LLRENVSMQEILTLNRKEQIRLTVFNQVEKKLVTMGKAASLLGLSERQGWRLLSAYRKEGAQGLAHGNRGKKPANAIPEELRQRVWSLATTKYKGFNHLHFHEKLAESEDVFLSRSSIRKILVGSGISSPQKRRSAKHRSRRNRYPMEGMMLQTDGSPHDWLEGRGPELCLIGAIDDATSEVPYAHFQEQEDSKGYILMLRSITLSHGIPLALYHDQHTIFDSPKEKRLSIEEQLEGKKPLTQLGRLMEELGINSISANSPQAKGRIERLWRTFQDRLTSELRLAGAKTEDEANHVLAWFLSQYNRKFIVASKEPGSAYRKPPAVFKPEEYFCYKYPRTVGADNVVQFVHHRLQVLPSLERASYAHCKVEVYGGLNGSLAVYFNGKRLATRPAPLETPRLRELVAAGISKLPYRTKPSPSHPWRGKYRTFVD
jgi:transposase